MKNDMVLHRVFHRFIHRFGGLDMRFGRFAGVEDREVWPCVGLRGHL